MVGGLDGLHPLVAHHRLRPRVVLHKLLLDLYTNTTIYFDSKGSKRCVQGCVIAFQPGAVFTQPNTKCFGHLCKANTRLFLFLRLHEDGRLVLQLLDGVLQIGRQLLVLLRLEAEQFLKLMTFHFQIKKLRNPEKMKKQKVLKILRK